MLNIILSLLFFILIIAFYLLIGKTVFSIKSVKKNTFALYVIVGWLFTYLIGWVIGFPMQLLGMSWDLYTNVFTIVLLLIAGVALYYQIKKKDNFSLARLKETKRTDFISFLKSHLKKYWFVYAFAIIFTLFSVTNMQQYTLDNYNDDFYLAKIVHIIHSSPILNEDYQYGKIITAGSIKQLISQQTYRIFNTYELVYSVFAYRFAVPVVYFVRVTMTFHNYFMCFLIFQLLSSIFLDEEYSQYGIAFFAFLLIPDGYSSKGSLPFTVRMFENWRFQTGIYMGSSIVRVCSLPLLIYFTYLIFKGVKRAIPMLIVIPIVLISYQVLGLSFFLLFIPIFILSLIMLKIGNKKKEVPKKKNRNVFYYSLIIALLALFLILSYYSDDMISSDFFNNLVKTLGLSQFINSYGLMNSYEVYYKYYLNVFIYDFFARFAWVPILALIIFSKKFINKLISIMIMCIYIVFALNKCRLFLSLITFIFYGSARLLTGVLMVIVCLFGIVMVLFLKSFRRKQVLIPLLSSAMIIGNIGFIKLNMKEILKYTQPGDAVVKAGFSLKPLTANRYMLPQMFVDVGKYIDQLPNSKYAVYAEEYINYRGNTYSRQSLLLASRKIMYATYHEEDKTQSQDIINMNTANWVLYEYYANKNDLQFYHNYAAVDPWIQAAKLQYAFLTRKTVKDDLVTKGWKVVVGSDQQGYWLLKSKY